MMSAKESQRMKEPQIIRTSSGEELVVLTRAEYDALIAQIEDAAEDAADAALAETRFAEIEASGDVALSPAATAAAIGYVRHVRRLRGMTQVQLAEHVGITQGALSDIESGRRNGSPAVMLKLAEALGLPAEQFLDARIPAGTEILRVPTPGRAGDAPPIARFGKQKSAKATGVSAKVLHETVSKGGAKSAAAAASAPARGGSERGSKAKAR
jgi:transcriptional regulator with XRE-family HTH domain